jgi:hypothetical protein
MVEVSEAVKPPPKESEGWNWWLTTTVTYVFVGLVFGAGAAKLSYERSRSMLYAVIAFLLSPLYYPFYAFSTSSSTASAYSSYPSYNTMMGAARKLKNLL